MKISYNWLQSYFDEKLPIPERLVEIITFHAFEVESVEEVLDDVVLDVKVLPDRAHDCLSHRGIAREISAILDIPMLMPKYLPYSETEGSTLTTLVESPLCRRYAGRIVHDVKMTDTPLWIRERLETVGQKSINCAVDIANYVMLELGQPIHVFDADKIKEYKLQIRNAKKGEKIDLLGTHMGITERQMKGGDTIASHITYSTELDDSILIIADQEGHPLAIAGVKGGKYAKVDEKTRNIIIEVANFDPVSIRKTSHRLGLPTDAAKRFENDLTPYIVTEAMENVTALIAEFLEGEPETTMDIYPNPVAQNEIKVTREYINKRLGTIYTADKIESVWKRLKFSYTKDDDSFTVAAPYERLDLVGPHDLSEEVGRILGYEHIKAELPHLKVPKEIDETFYKILSVRKKLLDDGYSEVMTYTFTNKGEVEVLASASDKKKLRGSLESGILESLGLNSLNANLFGIDKIKIFEIGNVFDGKSEKMQLCFGISIRKGYMPEEEIAEEIEDTVIKKLGLEVKWGLFARKGVAEIYYQSNRVGQINVNTDFLSKTELYEGAFVKKWGLEFSFAIARIDLDLVEFKTSNLSMKYSGLLDEGIKTNRQKFKVWSLYPYIARDISVWVPESIKAEDLSKIYQTFGTELLVIKPRFYSSYQDGEHSREQKYSLTFRLVFQSYDRTLTDQEINNIMENIQKNLENKGFSVR